MSDTPNYAELLRRSLAAIDDLEAKLAAAEAWRHEPIAIVGIGCRFAGDTDSPASFWRLLEAGVDAVTEVPPDRWNADAMYDPDPDALGKSYTRWGSFISNVDRFDAEFFGVSPREAVSLDPQQRLLLEVTWEALENAGIAPSSIAGSRSSVYLGMSTGDYSMRFAEAGGIRFADAYAASGGAHSMAAGRLSYVLGLHGPNMAIDTACSSSLVAVHEAVQSLRLRESDLSIAGGVGLTISPHGAVYTSRARMMSFDGRCKTFDASADGYVRGEGCGMLVLKRLSDAQRDGDTVLALIRGSAINQDGRSSGLTAPNGNAQRVVLRAALADAGLAPADVSYIEAHGTGTTLGDPIEVKALGEVFGERRADRPLMLGSVKTNIGHTEGAAGVAGIIKTVLALQHAMVPPHLHFRTPNPLVAWDQYPVTVPTVRTDWASYDGAPRRAGVSSFGFSGTNAHVILEEAPRDERQSVDIDAPQLLVLSAQTPQALSDLAARWRVYLAGPDAVSLSDAAATAAMGRSHLVERAAIVAVTKAGAIEKLAALENGEAAIGVALGRAPGGTAPEIVFLFTGQGAQYTGMAKQLYDTYPAFSTALDACAAALKGELDTPLLQVIFDSAHAALLDDTAYTQPALFAVEYALAQLWRSWGVEPTTVMGHSVGEYVAACLAGVFSLSDALRLIAGRGRLMSALPREGSMAAVFTDERSVQAALVGHEQWVSVAATNGPTNIVISGRTSNVDEILAGLTSAGVEHQRLNVSHAFHSPLMEPMLDEFERVASTVTFSPPQIGLVSNASGLIGGAEMATPRYWREHIRNAVRFAESIATLRDEGYRVYLEVGPSPTLLGMARRCAGMENAAFVSSLRKGGDDRIAMLEGLGRLHVNGVRATWPAVFTGENGGRRRANLPTYAFQRQRYWQDLDDITAGTVLAETQSQHPLLGGIVPSPLRIFQSEIGVNAQPWLADHQIFDFTPFPAAGFLEIALAAAREALGTACSLRDIRVGEALMLTHDVATTVQIIVTDTDGRASTVQVFSRPSGRARADEPEAPWRLHVSATIESQTGPTPAASAIAGHIAAFPREIDAIEYYERLRADGAVYGPAFRGIETIRRSGREVWGKAQLPPSLGDSAATMIMHPALLDACFQLIGAVLFDSNEPIYVPVAVDEYRVFAGGASSVWCHVVVEDAPSNAASLRSHLTMYDETGAVVAEIRGLEMRRVTRAALSRIAERAKQTEWLFETEWRSVPDAAIPRTDPPGRWLVLADGSSLGFDLAAQLTAQGAEVTVARASGADDNDASTLRIDLSNRNAVDALFTLASGHDGKLDGVISLVALDAAPPAADFESLERDLDRAVGDVFSVAQSVQQAGARLWLVTRGSQAVTGSVPNLVQAPVWSVGGVIAAEVPDSHCIRIDLDPVPRTDEPDRLFTSVWMADDESRVAYRDGGRYVARLVPGTLIPESERDQPLRLEIQTRGSLENLELRRVPREAPPPGHVEIRVYATGLNFRDVLNALGMYPGDPGPLGNECAGVITAVGEGVEDLMVGDEVIAMGDKSFATWVIVQAVMTVRKPANLTFAEAATIPVTFLTSEYALSHLGRMKKGDRVLIHAATGGVGMAATQLALRAGAEIFGTAGAPAKKALARALGVHHVADSRSLSFVEDVTRDTNGEGVDIVLNSLAGEFIPASLGLLREGGHFIEIGKTDIWDAATVAAKFPGISYHALYLGEITAARPQFMRYMLGELLTDFELGSLRPLPHRSWLIEKSEAAFRYMGQGLHTGKIVITQHRVPSIRSDATYLITGGLGGLGLTMAKWLVSEGARHIVLTGRSEPSTEANAAIAEMTADGAEIVTARADVGAREQIAAVTANIAERMPPLRGVIHAAGVVDDAVLADQTVDHFRRVSGAKVRGAWNLHELTAATSLDFFVMFSSGAALLGSPGQANYAAANSFLDALAHVRQARGLPAVSINWGIWREVGMAAAVSAEHHRRWDTMGLQTISPEDGARMLGDILTRTRSAQVAALPLVRSRLPQNSGSFLSEITAPATTARARETASVDVLQKLSDAPADQHLAIVTEFLTGQVGRVLALGTSARVDATRSLIEMGMDSLMAMELRNRIQTAVKVPVPVATLLEGTSIEQLASLVVASITPAESPVASGEAWEEGTL